MTKKYAPWRDPSTFYAYNENFADLLKAIPFESDGYPGYVMRAHYNADDDLFVTHRFFFESNCSTIDGIKNDPGLFDVAPFGSNVVIIPGYIVSDYDPEIDFHIRERVEEIAFSDNQEPLPFVEILMIPQSRDISIYDRQRLFPNLKQILFYESGLLDPNYEPKDVDPALLHLPESEEKHLHDYDYVYLEKDCPYHGVEPAEWDELPPRESILFTGKIYDIIYPNMIFEYDAQTDTAKLSYMPAETEGCVIVPDTIEVFGHRVPVVKVEGIWDYQLRFCNRITELSVPPNCDISLWLPRLHAIVFRQ